MVYAFATSAGAFFRCEGCGVLNSDPKVSHPEPESFWSDDQRSEPEALTLEEKLGYLDLIREQAPGKRLLEVGCGNGEFLAEAQAGGFIVSGLECKETLADRATARLGGSGITVAKSLKTSFPGQSFDVVIAFGLGRFSQPLEMMRFVRGVLAPGGLFVFCIPLADSRPARLLKGQWVEFHKRHLMLFDLLTIQNALFLRGFEKVLVLRHQRRVSIDWVSGYLGQFQLPKAARLFSGCAKLLPSVLRKKALEFPGGHGIVLSHPKIADSSKLLSIIIPVYNERSTVTELIETVLAKQIQGIRKEIIIVESNSSDGSRDAVLQFQGEPEIQIILQEKAQGKGSAVRAGFAAAKGDYILIQDADLEYDIDDYDALLAPLIAGREALVLGSRHGGGNVWKMRKFNDQSGLAAFVNFGHWIFATLLNVLFGQSLKDPFTMFKVFRRDCLHGLEFESNRFDFDFELLIKLILKGYRPIEVPVNYNARSFREGKKVRLFRDPLTWIRALAKLRLTKVDHWNHPSFKKPQGGQRISGEAIKQEAVQSPGR